MVVLSRVEVIRGVTLFFSSSLGTQVWCVDLFVQSAKLSD